MEQIVETTSWRETDDAPLPGRWRPTLVRTSHAEACFSARAGIAYRLGLCLPPSFQHHWWIAALRISPTIGVFLSAQDPHRREVAPAWTAAYAPPDKSHGGGYEFASSRSRCWLRTPAQCLEDQPIERRIRAQRRGCSGDGGLGDSWLPAETHQCLLGLRA
jgi:hypothetical protein